ncbi:MAG: UDP-N-acetylmuramate dehydrogenase [Acidimicrobiia bacterium]
MRTAALADLVEAWVPLAPRSTYKMGGPARYFCEASGEQTLLRLAGILAVGEIPLLVLGRGSNLVISDAGFPGLVVRLGAHFAEVGVEPDGTVSAGGSTSLPILARTASQAGRGGLEFFVGIPGSVGGAVRMNAGCHGTETTERLRRARVVSLSTGEVTHRDPAGLELGYRSSNLQPGEVVTRAWFLSRPQPPEESSRLIREVTRWRRDHQPGGTLNAGSVFRNPPGDVAGRLIDELGLKGMRVGSASVSQKHANFFVAEPGASAQDVYDLVWAVRRRVREETGIWLELEVQFAGPFRPSPDEGSP